jgi:hypothetical protein
LVSPRKTPQPVKHQFGPLLDNPMPNTVDGLDAEAAP